MKKHYVYILSGQNYGPIFIGTTRHLSRRLSQHRIGRASIASFRIDRLVHAERFDSIEAASARAEALKLASREWVDALVERRNPHWRDLAASAMVEAQQKAA